MDPRRECELLLTRRQLFGPDGGGHRDGGAGVAAVPGGVRRARYGRSARDGPRGALTRLHFAPRAKRVIYLFQSGAPSHIDLFDYKPKLQELHGDRAARLDPPGAAPHGHDLGAEVVPAWPPRCSSSPSTASSGAWVSELLPHTATIADDLCIVRSMHTEAINHDPAITFFQTGRAAARAGPASAPGSATAWAARTRTCPPSSCSSRRAPATPTTSRSSPASGAAASCPPTTRACKLRSVGDPVLYLSNPPGIDAASRRRMLDGAGEAQPASRTSGFGDPEIDDAHRPVRDGLPDADLRAGADGPLEGAGERLRAVRPRRAQAGHLRRQLPAGAAAGRARRALRPALPPRLGPARQPAQADPRPVPATPTSPPPPWSRTSSSAACWTTRWSSGAASSAAPSTARGS